jgi:hypothetical protein
MPVPRLTFFCELETADLQALFEDGSVIEDLQSLNAAVSLGLLDLKPERAEIVRRLNRAGLPVTAWLLLPKEQGYYSCLKTPPKPGDFMMISMNGAPPMVLNFGVG